MHIRETSLTQLPCRSKLSASQTSMGRALAGSLLNMQVPGGIGVQGWGLRIYISQAASVIQIQLFAELALRNTTLKGIYKNSPYTSLKVNI